MYDEIKVYYSNINYGCGPELAILFVFIKNNIAMKASRFGEYISVGISIDNFNKKYPGWKEHI